MSDLATLLTAIAAIITGVGSSIAGVITAVRRTSPRERVAAAEEVVEELLAAAADGKLTEDEMAKLKRLSRNRKHRREVEGE